MSEYSKKYYKEHKEKWKGYNNTEKYKKYQKEYNKTKRHRKPQTEESKLKRKEYRKLNKEKLSKYRKEYRAKNKDGTNEKAREYRRKNKDRMKEQNKKWREKNPDKIKKYKKNYRSTEKGKEAEKIYKEAHKEEMREYDKLWKREYRKTDKYREEDAKRRKRAEVKLHSNISRGIRSALQYKRKSKHTVEYLGCSIEFLKDWLEKQFYPNPETGESMTWENQGTAWHIDHIIPKSIFNINNETAMLSCWNYKNLRPLWEKENLIKHNKIENIAFIYKYFLSELL